MSINSRVSRCARVSPFQSLTTALVNSDTNLSSSSVSTTARVLRSNFVVVHFLRSPVHSLRERFATSTLKPGNPGKSTQTALVSTINFFKSILLFLIKCVYELCKIWSLMIHRQDRSGCRSFSSHMTE